MQGKLTYMCEKSCQTLRKVFTNNILKGGDE